MKIDSLNLHTIRKSVNFPCIAFLKEKEIGHYVVIYSISDKYLLMSDPNCDKIKKMKTAHFLEKSTGIYIIPYSLNKPVVNNEIFNKGDFLKGIIKNSWKQLLIVFIISVLFVSLTVINSFFFKLVIDLIIPGDMYYYLMIYGTFFILLNILNNFFDLTRNNIIIYLSNKIDKMISNSYFNSLVKLPSIFFENRNSGEIISRFNDATYIRNIVSNTIVSGIIDLIIVSSFSIVLYRINHILFLTVLVPIILLVTLTYIFYDPMRKNNKKVLEARANTNSYLYQFLSNMPILYSFNKKDYFIKNFDRYFSKQLNLTLKEQKLESYNIFTKKTIQTTASIIILWVGALQIMSDSMTVGDLFFINSLVLFIMTSIESLIGTQPEIQKSIIAANRFFEVFNYPSSNNERGKIPLDNFEKFKIKNLSFGFDNIHNILEGVNLTINKNEKIMFCGKSGSGKSTLSKLLVKIYSCKEERIFINDIGIEEYDELSLRDKVIYMNESPFIFKASILENICMGEHYNSEYIRKVCDMCGISGFIYSLPGNFEFELQENGSNISTGQKQRICLARALLKKPQLLILDESLSNVDLEMNNKILNNLIKTDITLIIVTHLQNNFSNIDKKYVFDNKNICEYKGVL